jgi:hypothetical protein
MKISIMPKMIGSVGKLNPNPPSKFCMLIAKGVRNTVSSISLSSEKIANNNITKAAGNKFR